MPSRVKCFHCLGCMVARWIDNKRYYYCDLCRIWYGGGQELIEVEDPTKKEVKDDTPNNVNNVRN